MIPFPRRYMTPRRVDTSPRHPLTSEQGYTLYLVLLILTVAGTLFTISLTSAAHVRVLTARHLQGLQARLLAASGLARTEYFLNGGDGHDLHWETHSFTEPVPGFGRIRIRCLRYGAFSRVSSTGIRLEKKHVLDGLLGRDVPAMLDPVLTLTSHAGGLVLEGGTRIGGKVVLHHGAVKRGRARIPLRGFRGWTDYRESPSLPFDVTPLADFMDRCAEQIAASLADSTAIRGDMRLTGKPDGPWSAKRVVVLGDCLIAGGPLEDATVIAAGTITLADKASCLGTTFLSEKIVIEGGTTRRCLFYSDTAMSIDGGTHASQFFCNDSITVGDDATFRPVSVWVSHRRLVRDTVLGGGVFFADRARVSGHVICYSDTGTTRRGIREGAAIRIGTGSTVEGTLITDGDIDIQRLRLKGHIWARSITTLRDETSYINWLFDCVLEPAAHEMVFPLVGDVPARVRLLR
jgi:hypothetical protein